MGTESGIRLTRERDEHWFRETAYRAIFFTCAAVSVLTTIAIIIALIGVRPAIESGAFVVETDNALDFFSRVPVLEFLTGTNWSPQIRPRAYGVLPLVTGTLIITLGSALIALPIGLLTAIYLSEYASRRVRSVLKPMLEILAGVPTVIYGYFALVYITPAIDVVLGWFGMGITTFNALSASIVVGIMIIPMVSSISEDAMSAVPDSLRQAGYGLGATKFHVSTSIVVPAAISGIAASYILAISRAIGETMAVTVAAGMQPRIPEVKTATVLGLGIPYSNPADLFLQSTQTMTAAMVQMGSSDVTGDSTAYKSLFAIGLTLFVITFTMNLLSHGIASRYREEYH